MEQFIDNTALQYNLLLSVCGNDCSKGRAVSVNTVDCLKIMHNFRTQSPRNCCSRFQARLNWC